MNEWAVKSEATTSLAPLLVGCSIKCSPAHPCVTHKIAYIQCHLFLLNCHSIYIVSPEQLVYPSLISAHGLHRGGPTK